MSSTKIDLVELPRNTLYWCVVIFYVAFQLISDVTAGKIIQIGPAIVSVTVLYFPITYILGDVLTEVYGFGRARRAIWFVLATSVLVGIIYQLVILLPPGPGFTMNDAYTAVFGQVPRILIAGWLAVFVGGIVNDFVMSRLKVITKGAGLWFRAITSTIAGEGVNTAIFYVGALYGVLPNNILVSAILWGWAIKVAVEVILLPLTYWIVRKLKKHEGMDVYDKGVDYNPFKM